MNEHCIEWRGSRYKPVDGATAGYGAISSRVMRRKYRRAHQWAYTVFYGPIPDGTLVMHTCDNPPCINPLHLKLGTNFDNMQDSARKGRNARQKQTHCAQGHVLAGANLLPYGVRRGWRICEICKDNAISKAPSASKERRKERARLQWLRKQEALAARRERRK